MRNYHASPAVTNCTFNGNIAQGLGGAVHNVGGSPTLTYCTLTGNRCHTWGSAVYSEGISVRKITNSIIWGNTDDTGQQIRNLQGATSVSYSCVEGGWPGTGNIDTDPMLVDADGADDTFGTADDDVHLLEVSPCINTGDDSAVTVDVTTDYEGDPRIQWCHVDMGADESPYYGVLIDCNTNTVPDDCDIANGTSSDIDSDRIPDECEPVHNITQNTIHVTIQEALVAAVAGDEIEVGPGTYVERISLPSRPIILRSTDGPEATIIDGDGGGPVISCGSNQTAATVIEGFTITNGHGQTGGGMRISSSSPTVTRCIFTANSAGYSGGGIRISGGSPTVTQCIFTANSATWYGGGLYSSGCGSPEVVNCTFSGNSADYGGGIYTWIDTETLATNCILWNNTASSGGPQVFDGEYPGHDAGVTYASYSCIEGGWPGTGNIATDPLFVDANGPDNVPGTPDDNLRLLPDSQCINAGEPGFEPADGETDLDGHTRVLCGRIDMGAYEFGIGDFDCDQVIDLIDFADWEHCMTGPNNAEPYGESCKAFDFEFDGDVDLDDFCLFQQLLAGAA